MKIFCKNVQLFIATPLYTVSLFARHHSSSPTLKKHSSLYSGVFFFVQIFLFGCRLGLDTTKTTDAQTKHGNHNCRIFYGFDTLQSYHLFYTVSTVILICNIIVGFTKRRSIAYFARTTRRRQNGDVQTHFKKFRSSRHSTTRQHSEISFSLLCKPIWFANHGLSSF
jgi:hypothetical protein